MNGRRQLPDSASPASPPPTALARPPIPAPPPRRASADDDELPELTEEQLGELKRLLEARRALLAASIDQRRGQERESGREVGDEMDEANTEGVSALTSKLLERDVQMLRDIDRALGKITDGSYGACEGTGEPIGYARLLLSPWARFGVAYQEEIERAARSKGGA